MVDLWLYEANGVWVTQWEIHHVGIESMFSYFGPCQANPSTLW